MTDAQASLLRWLWARGPTRQLRRPNDWATVTRCAACGWAVCLEGRWQITKEGIAALDQQEVVKSNVLY